VGERVEIIDEKPDKSSIGKVFSINIRLENGKENRMLTNAVLVEDGGVKGDICRNSPERQLSLLAIESIRKQEQCPRIKSRNSPFLPGDFYENITTEGLTLSNLKRGDKIVIKDDIVLEVSAIGRDCYKYCSLWKKDGDCMMPSEGIFAKVLKGGNIFLGDKMKVLHKHDCTFS